MNGQPVIPAAWLAALEPVGFDERYLALGYEQFLAGPGKVVGDMLKSPGVVQLWRPARLGLKLAMIRDRLLPPRESMVLMYPALCRSWRMYLYYLVRVWDLIRRYGLDMWQLAKGDPAKQAVARRTRQATELHEWLMLG